MPFDTQLEPHVAPPPDNRSISFTTPERLSLIDVWKVLMKRRYIILIVTILAVAGAANYAFRTPPVFESVSRIEIKPNGAPNVGLQGFAEERTGESSQALATEVRILQSDSVLFQTAQSLNLISRLRASGENKNKLGKASYPADITPQERAVLIGMIRGGLSVGILLNTNLVEIHFRSQDAKLGTAVVNTLAETYSDEDLRSKFDRTMHVSQWLQKQLEDLKQEASDDQRKLADYEREHNIVGSNENSNLTIQTLGTINNGLETAEVDRIMKESRMRDFEALNPDMVALMGDNPALAALRAQLISLEAQRSQLALNFGPNHPKMRDIRTQIDKVRMDMNTELAVARVEVRSKYQGALSVENALRKRLETQEEAAYRLNENVAQYSILRHEAELTRNLYDTLQLRLKEASVTAGLSAANITVVDSAQVPFIPVAPRKRQAMMFGFIGGLFGGCLLAFLVESIDDRLRTSEEVESVSMLPSLAAIPHVTSAMRKGSRRQMKEPGMSPLRLDESILLQDPKSNSAECYRNLRSSLLLSSIDNPPRVIVVTSALPGEGKTTTALNLAIALAQRGERVLLVDADLRRGRLHGAVGMTIASYGLSTVLKHLEVYRELPAPLAEVPTLRVLPTGPRPPNPAEMLSSLRMKEQLAQWALEYDRIVMDTAPLLAVSDTYSLARLADTVVLVIRAGVTRRRALIRARDMLLRVNVPIAGAVVNDVDMRLENFYTYRYGVSGYRYGYRYGYGSPHSDRAYGYDEEKKGE